MPFEDLDNVDELVMAERCPRCGTGPGRRCHNGWGNKACSTHKDRWHAAAYTYEQQREQTANPAAHTKERQQTRPSAAAQLDC